MGQNPSFVIIIMLVTCITNIIDHESPPLYNATPARASDSFRPSSAPAPHSPSTMAAKEPLYSLLDPQAERACFYGILLATLAYGALLMLYIQLTQVLLARPKRGQTFWAIVAYSSFLFPLATMAVGAIFKFSEMSYVDNRNFPGGPNAYHREHSSNYVNVIGQVSATLFPWVADILMLFRLLVIWNYKWWIVACPVLMYFAKMAISIPLLIAQIRPHDPRWVSRITSFGVSYHALTMAFNIYFTVMICIRLHMMRSQLQAVAGKLHASFYTSTVTLFVESGGFFTLWIIIYLIIRSRGSFVQDIFLLPHTFTLGITRMLIILRIAQDRAWSTDLVTATDRGVLEWQVSSTHSVPLHDIPSSCNSAERQLNFMGDSPTGTNPHPVLQNLRIRLKDIHEAISNYQPLSARPPILDSSLDNGTDTNEDGQWLQQENIQGLKKLRDSVKIDLDVLKKFLDDPQCAHLPPLSTNAPYLIAVWNEVLCAPAQVDSIFKSIPISGPSVDPRQRGTKRPPAVKVDVVADNGKRWIRVNTVKNSRMLAEFREIDSYLTDSDDSTYDNMEDARPTLAQTEFDNSVLQMGRSLLAAAKANPIEGTAEIPQITIRLTRLDPSSTRETENDPRIAQTLHRLEEMGISVQLGERQETELPIPAPLDPLSSSPSPSPPLYPSANINLDLSVLIALISDLTHAPLPMTVDEANRRFIPAQSYREWKQKKNGLSGKKKIHSKDRPTPASSENLELDVALEFPSDLAKHSRALTNQLLQEMGKGLLQEIHDKVSAISSGTVEFWTTSEARDRCLRIIAKIGGASEKRRAHALFWTVSTLSTSVLSQSEAEDLYWQDSRYPSKFVALFPIHIYPSSPKPDPSLIAGFTSGLHQPHFSKALAKTSRDILAQETTPHPRALPDELVGDVSALPEAGEIQRAIVTKANPRLTAHTVQSLLWGAELGWTTLTANKTSIKAILREMKLARVSGRLDGLVNGDDAVEEAGSESRRAAIWIVDPRSLAEGMCSLSR
ncbi:hypothetical protein D9615_003311 [Tricholomella constricta]|uniref:Uncharacterized protein n=1 Tax=Tricholomella constricta TaxID=117010 RepID=A0A8H5HJ93_9AGAR|nr:hypothetical protein D9615_003311 [Tricholomella constricta]